jgi:hypothetical protein
MSDSPNAGNLPTIRAGIVAGFFACLAYALIAIGRLPVQAVAVLVAGFGPAFCIAVFGLRTFLDLDGPLTSSSLGMFMNMLAGGIFSMMGMIQLAFAVAQPNAPVPMETRAIWLGFDVAWDAFLCCGTGCFALAMWWHPRFGPTFAFAGLALAAGLMTLHLITFPWPPQNRGFFDLGPAIGLWYLVVCIQMLRSLSWARQR